MVSLEDSKASSRIHTRIAPSLITQITSKQNICLVDVTTANRAINIDKISLLNDKIQEQRKQYMDAML